MKKTPNEPGAEKSSEIHHAAESAVIEPGDLPGLCAARPTAQHLDNLQIFSRSHPGHESGHESAIPNLQCST